VRALSILTSGLLLSACSNEAETTRWEETGEAVWFEVVGAGIDFVHVHASQRRMWLPEIMGSGVALFDYDQDGDLDLYAVQSGDLEGMFDPAPTNRLFANDGNGNFRDVTASAGVGDAGYGMGCAVGDYDGDGDQDLYVTNLGPDRLYRNNGDGTFTDVSAQAGIANSSWSVSAAFFDAEGDGDLDLFVANYLNWTRVLETPCHSPWGEVTYCSPLAIDAPVVDVVYENVGDGTFRNSTRAWGIDRAFGNGLGVLIGDFNADGRADIYVANDGVANQLWIGGLAADGSPLFEDAALRSGCALNYGGMAEASMGTCVLDLGSDGDPDLFMTHVENETNTLYENKDGLFFDASARTRLGRASLPLTGFGCAMVDFDQDGWLDLLVVNGRVTAASAEGDRYAEHDLLYRGTHDDQFELISRRGGLPVGIAPSVSRGAAFGDIDGDGDVDAVILDNAGPLRVLRNTVAHGSWLSVLPLDQNRIAVGSTVIVTLGERELYRWIQPAWSYASSNDPAAHFGLGEASEVSVRVRWPDGEIEDFGKQSVGRRVSLRRGAGDS